MARGAREVRAVAHGVLQYEDTPPVAPEEAKETAIPSPADAPPPAAGGVRRAVIICGLAGDPDHRKLFGDSVELLVTEKASFAVGAHAGPMALMADARFLPSTVAGATIAGGGTAGVSIHGQDLAYSADATVSGLDVHRERDRVRPGLLVHG